MYVARGTRPGTCACGSSRKSRFHADDSTRAGEEDEPMNSTEIRAQLARLHLERIDATEIGLGSNEAYMADLEEEIFECRAALVLTAVTEAAVARAELSGTLLG
jgi:hypothetical protein